MQYNIKYIEGGIILYRKLEGQLSFHNIFESWKYIVDNNLIKNEIIGVLNDFSCAKLVMNLENLKELINYFKEHSYIFNRIKLAVISHDPQTTVFPVFAENYYPEFRIKAFSTSDAAILWLKSA